EHSGIAEIGDRRRWLQRVAVGVIAEDRRGAYARKGAAHRADLVDAIVVRLSGRAGHELALCVVGARHHVVRCARLAQARAAPDVRGRRRAAAARRGAADRGAAVEAVIGKARLLARLARIREAYETVLRIPGVIALSV